MFPDNLFKLKTLNKINFIFFISFTIYSFIFSNLFYLSIYGVDYEKYIKYLEFFFGNTNSVDLEQSPLYYSIVALIINLRSNYLSPVNLLYELSFSIQLANFLFLLFGYLGFYCLLKSYSFSKNKSLLVLNLLNVFPPLVALRVTMKPEIFAFSVLPWIIFFTNEFYNTKKKSLLYINIIPVVLLFTSKGSALGMYLIFILFFLPKIIKLIDKKKLFLLLYFFILIFMLVSFENAKINNFQLLDFRIDSKYDNKALPNIIYKNNLGESRDIFGQKIYKNTLIGITLSDTFGDFFNLYWDKDVSIFSKFEKNIFIKDLDINSIRLNFEDRNFSVNFLFDTFLINLRDNISIIFSLGFYLFIIKSGILNKKSRIYFFSPFIGMLILYINSLGFPSNNFDPYTADTFKTFYYAPLLSIAFIFSMKKIFNKIKNKYSIFLICLIYFFGSIYILGFPKEDTSQYLAELESFNEHNVLCQINRLLIIDIPNKTNCANKIESFCEYQDLRSNLNFYTSKKYEKEISGFLIQKFIVKKNNFHNTSNICNRERFINLIDYNLLPMINLIIFLIFIVFSITFKLKFKV